MRVALLLLPDLLRLFQMHRDIFGDVRENNPVQLFQRRRFGSKIWALRPIIEDVPVSHYEDKHLQIERAIDP